MNDERRYRILEVLGRGSFGVVYRADLLGTAGFSKTVAIKVLKATAFAQEEIEQRLRDEARMLGMLRHPNVVRVDGLARFGEGWAVVMEYIAGVDGGELVRAGNVPPRAALEMAEEVASALHAAWAVPSELTGEPLRIIHRDLKPSNVRVTAHGEVKVLDFGAARGDFDGRESSTQAWRFGTPRYMSPERHDGVEGPEGDIYAVGLLLAQLLGALQDGEPPTHPTRHARFLVDLQSQISQRIAARNPEIDENQRHSIVTTIETLLAFEPKDRPDARTAQQLLRATASDLTGLSLRDWAEDAIPAVEALLPPYTSDERCGLVVMEGMSMPDASAPRVGDETLAVEIELPTRAQPTDQRTSSRRVIAGFSLSLLLVGLVSFALLPASVPRPSPPAAIISADEVVVDGPSSPEVDAPPLAVGRSPVKPKAVRGSRMPPISSVSDTPNSVESANSSTEPVEFLTVEPLASSPPKAHIELAGGATELRLSQGDTRYTPGDIPPGTYTVEVRFADGVDFVPAGRVTLGPEERVRITCSATLLRCRKEAS